MATRWKQHEIAYLFEHASEGAEAIAETLNRSVQAVVRQASRYGISLRKTWYCPKCSQMVYSPLSEWSGWCRKCSVMESKDRAAVINRKVRLELNDERRRIKEVERERQAIYSDTNKKRKKLRRLRESCPADVNHEGEER